MKIKYWSDIACPFCYIGSTRMKRAIKELGIADETPLEFKAFQLDPTLPTTTTKTMTDNFAGGHGMTVDQAQAQMAQIEQMGAGDGLTIDLAHAIPTNTMDAHRLIKLAQASGDAVVTEQVITALYHVYFSEGASIADHTVLRRAVVDAGLPAAAVDDVLASDKYAQDVRRDEAEAQQLGIQGAPFFVLNDKYGISGAQPYDTMVSALRQVLAEEVD
ncbi:DsbA family oxidoreductase [Levilactobacillus suantsaii]|uniref:DsbA family oxidoreductase n=1 Tax=Levilactobacillus suantsaii TaxID=2292255 RepID=A0A4Q0VMH4_9LACO|nr:DsbA family oxidoreductase [Levilactobacillus suantsaii]QMU07168.1 DsbA family oxidoreductase [Levilactobacillus suantsaii]RXI80058.1 DsbA family oxidoreductase [Levilactobacillus suantsaii]